MSINLPKYTDLDYINFLIAASNAYSCTEAARCFPSSTDAPSYDCFTRLLQKQPSDTEPLWDEVRKFVNPNEGYLIVDDSTLDKPYSKNIGFVKVFRIVPKKEDTQYWATDVLDMDESEREDLVNKSWKIEEYHRGIKQFCGVGKCQARKKESQRAHIMFSLRAFLRLEVQRIKNGISWFESKMKIQRVAAIGYLNRPRYKLNTATA